MYFRTIHWQQQLQILNPFLNWYGNVDINIVAFDGEFSSEQSFSLEVISVNDAPVIDPNYLDHYEDINDLKCAFDFIRKISNSLHLKKIIDKALDIDPLKSSDEELIDYFRKKSNSVYHPCGTCRMDYNIQNGVVSKRLKVHGVENLWIVDASVFPNITSGNINASVMMLANRATKLIIDDLNNNN